MEGKEKKKKSQKDIGREAEKGKETTGSGWWL